MDYSTAIIPFHGKNAADTSPPRRQRASIPMRELVDTSDDDSGSEHSCRDLDCSSPLVKSLMKTMPREHMDSLRLVTVNAKPREQDSIWPSDGSSSSSAFQPDFIGSTASLGELFKLPYSSDAVTVGLHRIGTTLMVDGNMEEAVMESQKDYPAEGLWLPEQSLIDTAKPIVEPQESLTDIPKAKTDQNNEIYVIPSYLQSPDQTPFPQGWKGSSNTSTRSFARQFHWNLHEMKLLLGSDQMVAGTLEHPRVSVKVHDDTEDLTLCTCLDYYLDNVMENVPELAFCLRSKGYIQGCRLVQTEEIPYLKGSGTDSLFEPQVVELNATLLLRFLQQHCSRDGGLYLLRRPAGGGAVQLYDVQTLSEERQKRWQWLLAMMCYRFASRISQHLAITSTDASNSNKSGPNGPPLGALREQLQKRRRSLLHNSLQLLSDLSDIGGGRHDTISAAVQEQIAETFLNDKDNAESFESLLEGDIEKAKEHLGEGISILQRAHSQIQQIIGGSSTSEPVLIINENQPVAVLQHETNFTSENTRRKHSFDRRAFVFGDFKVEWDETVVPERERDLDNHAHTVNYNGSDNKENVDQLKDIPATAAYLLSQQLLSLQIKLTNVNLLHTSKIVLGEKMDMSRISTTIVLLQKTNQCLKDALSTLYALRNEDGIDENATAISETPYDSENLNDLGRLYAGSLSEALATNQIERNNLKIPEQKWSDESKILQDYSKMLLELIGDVSHSLLELTRTETIDAQFSHLSNVLSELTSPIDVSTLDPCGDAHGQKWSWEGVFSKKKGFHGVPCTHKGKVLAKDKVLLPCLLNQESQIDNADISWKIALTVCACYCERIKLSKEGEPTSKIMRKLGDCYNFLGQLTSSSARSFHARTTTKSSQNNIEDSMLHAMCLVASESWFHKAKSAFDRAEDTCNAALVLLNLASTIKLKPRIGLSITFEPNHLSVCEDIISELAADICNDAHSILNSRDTNPNLWDTISSELAMTYLSLGTARRIGASANQLPVQSRAWRDRHILTFLEKSLQIYTRLDEKRQIGAANYQLGMYFSNEIFEFYNTSDVSLYNMTANFLSTAVLIFDSQPDCESLSVIAALELAQFMALLGKSFQLESNGIEKCVIAVRVMLQGGSNLDPSSPLIDKIRNTLPTILLTMLQYYGTHDEVGRNSAKAVYRECITNRNKVKIEDLLKTWMVNIRIAEARVENA